MVEPSKGEPGPTAELLTPGSAALDDSQMSKSDIAFHKLLDSGLFGTRPLTPAPVASDIAVRRAGHDHQCPGWQPKGQMLAHAA